MCSGWRPSAERPDPISGQSCGGAEDTLQTQQRLKLPPCRTAQRAPASQHGASCGSSRCEEGRGVRAHAPRPRLGGTPRRLNGPERRQSGLGSGSWERPPPCRAIMSGPAPRPRAGEGARLSRGEAEGARGRVQLPQLPGGEQQPKPGRKEGEGARWMAPRAARVPFALTLEGVASNFYLLRKQETIVLGDLTLECQCRI